MNRHAITFMFCFILALAQPLAAQQQMGTGVILDYPDTALGGVAAVEVSMPFEECRRLCFERSGCAGFDHSATTSQCRLLSAIGSGRQQLGSRAGTRNRIANYRDPANLLQTPVQPQPQLQPQPRNFDRYPHYDLSGFDLAQMPSNSVAQCEDSCRANNLCIGYTYNAWNQKCFLKNGATPLRIEPRATSGLLNGTSHPGYKNTPVVMEYYRNYIISGSAIGNARPAGNRDHCENLCWSNNACIAFNFSTGQKRCTLLEDADNRFPQTGIESGSKIQPRP